jgi:hypothetical protein
MESEVSLQHSKEPSTGSYPQLSTNPSYVSKIHLEFMVTPTSTFSYLLISFWLSHKNFIFSPMRASYPANLILLHHSSYAS